MAPLDPPLNRTNLTKEILFIYFAQTKYYLLIQICNLQNISNNEMMITSEMFQKIILDWKSYITK